jgi:hypothetical protein
MFNRLFRFDNSSAFNFIQNKRKFMTLSLAIVAGLSFGTTSGIVPLNIAGVQTQQSASAGCASSRTTWAWWGTYTYLNKCAALETAAAMRKPNLPTVLMNTSGIPHIQALGKAVGFNRWVVGNALESCANRHGQAYLKYPYSFAGSAAEVSCR